jgi:hypothetical protein
MNVTAHGSHGPAVASTERPIAIYAWAVLGTHVSALFYFLDTRMLRVALKGTEPLCWPYFESCWWYRFESADQIAAALFIELLLIVAAGIALGGGARRTFTALLVVLNVYLFGLMLLDYRLRGNEFYMLFWLNAVYLAWPAKRWSIPVVIVSFYVWEGALKLNYEWLSGAVLYHPLWMIPPAWAWLARTYVVVLEMLFTWALLARRRWLWIGALAQLALFHLESLSQIHWFYPLLMAAILSWFAIDRLAGDRQGAASVAALVRGRAPRAAYAILAVFAAFQLTPYLYRGDKTLTGQGRLFALHMFEARQICEVSATLHRGDDETQSIDLRMPGLNPREICDPVVYFSRVENLCRSRASDLTLADIDWTMRVKRTTDATFTTVVDETGFCAKGYTYSLWTNNAWIR